MRRSGRFCACTPRRAVARFNRAFLQRAVRFLAAEAGIGQFLDIGTGIPSAGNVHEVAGQAAPGVGEYTQKPDGTYEFIYGPNCMTHTWRASEEPPGSASPLTSAL